MVQEAAIKTMNRIAPTASNTGVVVSNVESANVESVALNKIVLIWYVFGTDFQKSHVNIDNSLQD